MEVKSIEKKEKNSAEITVSVTPEEFEAIRAKLREKQAENKLPYELNVSIGWDVLQEKNDSLEACLARADQKLYEIKRARR